jgi:hypothetical protein
MATRDAAGHGLPVLVRSKKRTNQCSRVLTVCYAPSDKVQLNYPPQLASGGPM